MTIGVLPAKPQINANTDIWGFKSWFEKAQNWMKGASDTYPLYLTASFNVDQDSTYLLYPVDTTSGSVVATLPPANGTKGKAYVFKKVVAANTLTVTAYTGDTIDGAATFALTSQWGAVLMVSDGVSKWNVVSQYPSGGGSTTAFSPYPAASTLTVPLAASFTPFGVAGLTITDKSDRMQWNISSTSGRLRGMTRASIATPYTIDTCVGVEAAMSNLNDAIGIGICLSDGTKYIAAYNTNFGGNPAVLDHQNFGVDRWTTNAIFGNQQVYLPNEFDPSVTFVRVTDDGAQRRVYSSNNGKDFVLMFAEATNTYLTPTRFGIAAYNNAVNAFDTKMVIYHWLVTPSILGDAP